MQRWARVVVCLGLLVAGLPGTGRADYWKYTKDNGSSGFADELKQVPARYREQAVRHADGSLAAYPRYTPVLPVREDKAASAVQARAAGAAQAAQAQAQLRAEAEALAAEQQASLLLIEAAPGVNVPVVEDSQESQEPLRVDRHVLRWEGGRSRWFTIVRRGEQVISEIEER